MARTVSPDTLRKNAEAILTNANKVLDGAEEKVTNATNKRDKAQEALDKAVADRDAATKNKRIAEGLLAQFGAAQTVAPEGAESAEAQGIPGEQEALV